MHSYEHRCHSRQIVTAQPLCAAGLQLFTTVGPDSVERLYTGGVRFRAAAFVLALLVGASPIIGTVCTMDCDQPSRAKSPPCHDAGARHGLTWHGAPHACDQDHTAARPALLTSVAGGSGGPSVGALNAIVAWAFLSDRRVASAGGLHGPPGISAHRPSSSITVLRI